MKNHLDRRNALSFLSVALAAPILSACSQSGFAPDLIQSPSLSVTGFSLLEAGPRQQIMQLDTTLFNPNPIPLPLNSGDLGLQIAGVQFGRIGLAEKINILAQSQSRTKFNFQTDLLTSIQQLGGFGQVRRETPIPYSINGRVGVSSLNVILPIRHNSTFTLAQFGDSLVRILGVSI